MTRLENKTWNWAVDREFKKGVLGRYNGFITRRVVSKLNIWRFKVVTGFLVKEFSNCKQCLLYFFEIYGLTTRGENDTKKGKTGKKKKRRRDVVLAFS